MRSIQQNMAKKASATINLESDDHHVYTQMIDPSNASLSIMTNSNDASNDNHQSTLNCSQQKKSKDQNLGSISSSSAAAAVVPTNCHPNNGVTSHTNKNNHNHNGAHDLNDDTESIASHVSFGSSTDGIDVLRGNIGTPNNFFDWSHLIAARLVSSVLYKRTMLFCILLSSLLLAIRTIDQIRESSRMIYNIELILHFLLVLFTMEALLAIACFRELVLSTGWLCSDIVIICMVWYSNDTTFLILRAFRLIRALRKASSVPSLQWAVRSILHVLPRLTAVILVLVPLMIAIFAILFTNLYQDADLALADAYIDGNVSNVFQRLDVSALTLFQIMTGGRNWADISTTLMTDGTYPMAWLPLIGYVIVSMFFAATLVIALMCDAVTTVKRNQVLRVFEPTDIHHSKKVAIVSQSPDFHDVGYAPKSSLEPQQLYHRLEHKIDELNNNVEVLLRIHVELQESINRLSVVQHRSDSHISGTLSAPLSPRQQLYQQQQLDPNSSIVNNLAASSTSFSTALLVPRLASRPTDEH